MLREQKDEFISKMRSDVENAAGVLFIDYTGLKVQEADSLRRKFRAANIGYHVVKNTLMTRVLEGTSYESAAKCLKGTPTGVVIGFDDPVTPAKITIEFLKETEHLKVKGGICEKKAISPAQVKALSEMPSKEEIQATVVAQALSPGRKLLSQIKHPAGRVLGAILKLVENKEQAGQ
jgi:large subunit ribosomal protein L10